jgi:hypothetical protein
LTTGPTDVGCAETFELLDECVERQLAFGATAALFPEIAVDLASCNGA